MSGFWSLGLPAHVGDGGSCSLKSSCDDMWMCVSGLNSVPKAAAVALETFKEKEERKNKKKTSIHFSLADSRCSFDAQPAVDCSQTIWTESRTLSKTIVGAVASENKRPVAAAAAASWSWQKENCRRRRRAAVEPPGRKFQIHKTECKLKVVSSLCPFQTSFQRWGFSKNTFLQVSPVLCALAFSFSCSNWGELIRLKPQSARKIKSQVSRWLYTRLMSDLVLFYLGISA